MGEPGVADSGAYVLKGSAEEARTENQATGLDPDFRQRIQKAGVGQTGMFAKQLSPRQLIGKGVAKANSTASFHWPVVKHQKTELHRQQAERPAPLSLPGIRRGRRNQSWHP